MIPPNQITNRARQAAAETAIVAGLDPERRIAAANRWRDQLNPLRNLTATTVAAWLDEPLRGVWANIQWSLSFIEKRDPDMIGLVERRVGMLSQMDWDAMTVEKRFRQRGVQFDAVLAAEQQAMLRGEYDQLTNLYDAIEALEMAAFRGYGAVQFLADGEPLRELNVIAPWHMCRDGLYGDWFWNPDATAKAGSNMPDENRMDLNAYLFRTHSRPIGEFALIKYMRNNLSAKDWDAFLEIYGIPGWIVVLPPNVPDSKVADYTAAATAVAQGGSGALPNGASAICADAPRGEAPFQAHMDYWSSRLVLAGTGGLLTMLSAPGSGTLAGSAHWQAFEIVARSEARVISAIFQRSLDRYLLAREFPGQPALAYFDLRANDELDPGVILDHVGKIVSAGGVPDWTQISERTGYKITPKPEPAAPLALPPPPPPLRNTDPAPASSAASIESISSSLAAAQAQDFAPIAARLDAALRLDDPAARNAALAALDAELPDLARQLLANPSTTDGLFAALAMGVLQGYVAAAATKQETP